MIWIILTIVFYLGGFIWAYIEIQSEYITVTWRNRFIALRDASIWFIIVYWGWLGDVWGLIREKYGI